MDNKIMRGNILRELRESRKLNQADVAAAIGVSQPSYQTYETGRTEPKFDVLCAIADFFGVSTDYLLGRRTADKKRTPEMEGLIELTRMLNGRQIEPLISMAGVLVASTSPAPYADNLREAVEREQAEADAELLK